MNEPCKCLNCFYCHTRTFRNLESLSAWCRKENLHIRINWIRKLLKQEELTLFWCTHDRNRVEKARPRMQLTPNSVPFLSICRNEKDILLAKPKGERHA